METRLRNTTTMAGIPGIHTQLDIGILADVSILATVFVFVSSITWLRR